MVDAGVWLSRKQRRSFHQPRLRRKSHDELIQIDGSKHRLSEDHGEPYGLLVFIDDATSSLIASSLMQLRFVAREHGLLLLAFYSDRHWIFRIKRDAQGGAGMTQFGCALAELNIEIICANCNQANGRVERANRTL